MTTRLTLDIPVDLHRQLKAMAALRGLSMREMLEAWIRETVEREQQEARQGQA